VAYAPAAVCQLALALQFFTNATRRRKLMEQR
jgi:hypothetical protein